MKLEQIKNTLLATQAKNEVVANNLANIQTTGYKKDVMFVEYLEQSDTVKSTVKTSHAQGKFLDTKNSLDLAISGAGFFAIETPEGERYSRNGHFALDAQGAVVTGSGDYVLGEAGRIYLPSEDSKPGDITISSEGDIFYRDTQLDTLKIISVTDPGTLKKTGDGYFMAGPETEIQPASNHAVLQGKLEESNVNPIDEMVQLIEIQRQYESLQRTIRSLDMALGRAVNDIPRY
ncbi:MAG: flagellar hook-basal body protein [Fidelibacterota bacterium]